MPHCTYTRFSISSVVAIQYDPKKSVSMLPTIRGTLHIWPADTTFGVPSIGWTAVPVLPHARLVPFMTNKDSLPYFSWISLILAPYISHASSQVMRTQPGSSPLGLVRLSG